MNDERITTPLGTTQMYSNGRFHGKHMVPILYLHGGPGSPDRYAVDRIDYNGPVYTYDQFGCGRSDAKDAYTPDLFVQQLREIIEKEFDWTDIIIMGASWGGTLACLYAEKYGTEGLKGIIISSPLMDEADNARRRGSTMASLPEETRLAIEDGNRERFFGETYALAYRAYFKEEYGRHNSEESCDWCFRPTNEVYRQMWGPDESECTGANRGLSVVGGLGDIDVPVLYISGDNDIHSEDDVRRYASMIPDVELHILPDTGHFVATHPDYDGIIRAFAERVADDARVPDENDFHLQEDYDMVLSQSPHDTPANLQLRASGMSYDECMAEARRYEAGNGVPRSFLSASIFADEASRRRELEPVRPRIDTVVYDAGCSNRRLILSSRGLEAACCTEMMDAYGGCRTNEDGGCILRKDREPGAPDREIRECCPFCGCRMEFLRAQHIVEISSDEEYRRVLADYAGMPHLLEDYVSIHDSLMRYWSMRLSEGPEIQEMRRSLHDRLREQEDERARNVTGILTRSSAGFESACCRKFAEHFEGVTSWQSDRYYAGVKFDDGKHFWPFKICPYCGARMKRVPRTYRLSNRIQSVGTSALSIPLSSNSRPKRSATSLRSSGSTSTVPNRKSPHPPMILIARALSAGVDRPSRNILATALARCLSADPLLR